MGYISDTLQTLERVLEYKKASRDILMAASRQAEGYRSEAIRSIAQMHQDDIDRIPVIFKGLDFQAPPDPEEMPLTEIRPALFQDVGSGNSLNLLVAAINVEKEALRLLAGPLEKAESDELRAFLRGVMASARRNIGLLEGIDPDRTAT